MRKANPTVSFREAASVMSPACGRTRPEASPTAVSGPGPLVTARCGGVVGKHAAAPMTAKANIEARHIRTVEGC
jgi:hypothetical protein